MLLMQLDLKLEARNLVKFQDLMNSYESIKFPTPILPYVTNSVLVESFEVCECPELMHALLFNLYEV